MALRLNIDPHSGLPIYLQLVEQIERAVAIGVLAMGEQLPTIKQISSDLVINPSTVSRALRELEHIGIVRSLPGRGAFISDNGTLAAVKHNKTATVRASLDCAVREARSLGVSAEAVREEFDRAHTHWYLTPDPLGEV
ncbi:MAG: GntR family transcriptional regulator [Candidatus Eremiobacteraeota bacterium]|nr:GntR family transcriptional regulator [Candidatus Eremiobacteraeota bacterium]